MCISRFPIELIHEIFSYFSCNEIVQSFYSINEHINNIILNYNGYSLDLSSSDIRKHDFDLICSLINPSQIIRLKIGQSRFNLFGRYFIELNGNKHLNHLRSFWINETFLFNKTFFKWFYSNINLNNLISFRYDSNQSFENTSNYLFKNLFYLVSSSSATFLRLSNKIPPPNLIYLHMYFNSLNHLDNYVIPNNNKLKSLGIGIKCQLEEFCLKLNNCQWNKLIQFNLYFQEDDNIQFKTIRLILSSMTKLRYLTLIFNKQTSIHNDLFDGILWETFLSINLIYLKKFSLKIPVDESSSLVINNCLNRFHSRWWVYEKQWFITYYYEEMSIITLQDFYPNMFNNFQTTSSHIRIGSQTFYSNIFQLKLDLNSSDELFQCYSFNQPLFPNVKHLTLNGYLTDKRLKQILENININIIEHFQYSSTINHIELFSKFLKQMSNLYSFNIKSKDILPLFKYLSLPLISIRYLTLSDYSVRRTKMILHYGRRLFPNLTNLKMKYHSRRLLCYLLNKFLHLEQIHLDLNEKDYVPNHKWIVEKTGLNNNSFESQIFNINNQERIFIIWINQEK